MSQGVDAFSILALTFTNKAAREMKSRIAQIVGASEAKNLWMGTPLGVCEDFAIGIRQARLSVEFYHLRHPGQRAIDFGDHQGNAARQGCL
jgi:hypothetical protein